MEPIDTEGVTEADVVALRKQLAEAEKRAQAAEMQNQALRSSLGAFETTVRVITRLLHP